jgi:hypothetical protein
MQEQYTNTPNTPKESVVFATENDGIVYEWKPENKKGVFQYRQKKM